MGLTGAEREESLTLLEPRSRFVDKPLKFQVVCPQNGTAVVKGLSFTRAESVERWSREGREAGSVRGWQKL